MIFDSIDFTRTSRYNTVMEKSFFILLVSLAAILPACGKFEPVETPDKTIESAEPQPEPQAVEEEAEKAPLRAAADYESIHDAAKDGNIDAVCYLLSKGADIDARDERDKRPLYYAIESGNIELVRTLIDRGAKPWVRYLFTAIEKNRTEAMQMMVDAGSDVNETGPVLSQTPLMYAVQKDRIKCAEILLDAGANVNALTMNGASALNLAKSGGMKKLLLEHGAKTGKELRGEGE